MDNYDCKRCGHEFKTKGNLKTHLHRKTPCDPLISNVSQSELLEELNTVLPPLQKIEILNNLIEIQTNTIKNLSDIVAKLRDENKNAYYQKLLEIYFNAGHKKVKCGVTDITTETAHIEIEKWDYWTKCIGELLVYNISCPKESLQAHFFSDFEEESKKDAIKILSSLNIKSFEIRDKGDNVDIICLETNNIIHSFYIPELML